MSDIARNILTTVFCFSKSRGNITHETIDIQDQVPVKIEDITVTPFTVDHSAYRSLYVSNTGRRKKNITYTETLEITATRESY